MLQTAPKSACIVKNTYFHRTMRLMMTSLLISTMIMAGCGNDQLSATNPAGGAPAVDTSAAPIAKDIILYAGDLREAPRGWRFEDDRIAAGGRVLSSQEACEPSDAATASFVEFKFVAEKDVRYRVWIHLRCGAKRWMQNSLMMQLSDATTSHGDSFAPGSAQALVLQFWSGQSTPERGWTCHDEYREPNRDIGELIFTFKSTGEKTLRILCNEQGTAFDQIVISSDKWAASAPDVRVIDRKNRVPKNSRAIYRQLFELAKLVRSGGGQLFMHSLDCSAMSRFGALEYINQPHSEAPKYDAPQKRIEATG